jgi:hypothetical protein
MWRHWCYINSSTVWWMAPYWNSINAPSRHYIPQTILRNANLECKAITDWLIRKRLSQWSSSLHRGMKLRKTTKSLNSVKLHLFPDIWHGNRSDIADNVLSIMKVKEYRFHVSIYHYFLWTTGHGAPRMHCNMKDGVNCRDWTRFPDPLWRHPSYGQVGSPSNPDPTSDGNARMPSGHSRRTTELGRVEWPFYTVLVRGNPPQPSSG